MSLETIEKSSERRFVFWLWYRCIRENIFSSIHVWEQTALLVLFGLLLSVVIATCTGYLSLPIAGGVLIGLVAVVYLLLQPQLALLLVLLGAGLPSLQIPLPGHTMRPIELALLLCLMIIILRRPTMRLRFPHVLALLFLT